MTIAALLAAGLISLQSAGPQTFDVRPGPADQALNRLAAQAGVDIVISANLRGRHTPGLSGRMPVDVALDRLLRPLEARAVRIGEGMYRIEAAPRPRRPPAPPLRVEAAPPVQLDEVIVTAVPPAIDPVSGATSSTTGGSGGTGR